MVEWRHILTMAERGTAGGALATLVHVQGSSYRRPGARLYLSSDGRYAGGISGGCLEGELTQRARWLLRNGPVVQLYSTAFDDADEMPYGLGCGGELHLLLELADSREALALLTAAGEVLGGARRRVVTWLPGVVAGETRPLRRAIFASDAEAMGTTAASRLLFASPELNSVELCWAEAATADASDGAVFVEVLEPPQRLLVFGAGDDAQPVVTLAAALGWNVVVADGRRQLARADRFVGAQAVNVLEAGRLPPIEAADAVVLMTHSYEQDRELLAAALPCRPRYLGLLGARHRSSLLVSEAAERLGWPLAECCAQLHAPIGLDLGGDGAQAIALAVIAEIQALLHGRPGSSRRLSPEEVTAQISRGGALPAPERLCALGVA